MSTPDPLTNTYVAGLDLVAVQIGIGAAGAVIGRAPITEVMQLPSVFLYCKRHSNIDRMIASVRFQCANVSTRASLSWLVAAVLKSADAFGVSIMTETEIRIAAVEAIAEMETELSRLQSVGGLAAINRSAQNDTAAAQGEVPAWHGLEMLIEGSSMGCWRNLLAILYRIGVITLSTTLAIVGPRLPDTIGQLCDGVSKWVKQGERLIVRLLRHLLAAMLR
jgi:hypothetical protein